MKRKINFNYISGFIDGEGSFNVTISKDKKRSNNYRIICEMHITQNERSVRVLEEIKEYLKCGIVKTDNKLTKTMKYQISSIIDIKEILIPYLEEYPLLTSKYLNYQTFKEVIEIMYKKEHLTKEGVEKIKGLVRKMNNKRTYMEKYEFIKNHLSKSDKIITPE